MADYTLYNGDCLDVMATLTPGQDWVLVTDPPYGVNLGNHGGANETRPGLLVKAGGYEDTAEYFGEIVVPAIELALSMTVRGAVFCVPPSMWKLPAPNVIGGIYVPSAVGRNKWGWSNMIHCLLYGTAPELNKGAWPTAITSNARAEKTGHPTTKPLPWLTWLIGLATRPGDTVIDPFMGSGTTGVACKQMGRSFIGIEKDATYFEIAKQRIDAAQYQPSLLDGFIE